MRLVWTTDLHLNSVPTHAWEQWVRRINALETDGLVITGDISEGDNVVPQLQRIASEINLPVYFVLGNHDFYGSTFQATRQNVIHACRASNQLHYLTDLSALAVSEGTYLLGEDGWADGTVGNYDEFFRVKNGDVIDHLTKKPIADEFNGNEIKKYDESGETTIEEEDDTGGRITMNSKAYFVEDIVNGVNVHGIISNIGANVDAANGLISSDGHDNYDNLLQYRSSNEWCGNIQVAWDIPSGSTTAKNAGKNRYYTYPYDKPCNTNTGGNKRLRKTTKKKAIYNSYSSSQLKSLAKKMNVTTSGTKKEVATRILKMRGFLPTQHKYSITKKQRKTLKNILTK